MRRCLRWINIVTISAKCPMTRVYAHLGAMVLRCRLAVKILLKKVGGAGSMGADSAPGGRDLGLDNRWR